MAALQIVREVASFGVSHPIANPGIYAFQLFSLATSAFEATMGLLAAHQPVQALLTLRSVVIVAARMEQITQDGFGVAIRDALDHWESFQSRSSLGPEQIQVVASKVAEISTQGAEAGVAVPDALPSAEGAPIWTTLGAEMQLADIAAKACHGAALHHLRSGPGPDEVQFHTSIDGDWLSDMVASAAVIAELQNLQLAADLFGWGYDADRIADLRRRAAALNEAAANFPS